MYSLSSLSKPQHNTIHCTPLVFKLQASEFHHQSMSKSHDPSLLHEIQGGIRDPNHSTTQQLLPPSLAPLHQPSLHRRQELRGLRLLQRRGPEGQTGGRGNTKVLDGRSPRKSSPVKGDTARETSSSIFFGFHKHHRFESTNDKTIAAEICSDYALPQGPDSDPVAHISGAKNHSHAKKKNRPPLI